MSWPVPAAGDIAERYAVGFEQAFLLDPETGLPRAELVDARDPNNPLRAIGIVGEQTHTELYLYQASLADELMIDTAQDLLPRHAAEWGVPRFQPLTSLGNLVLTGAPGTALPAGIVATGDTGLRYITRAAAVMPAGGAVLVPAEALDAGPASNLAPGDVLQLVSAVAGLDPQSATADAAGFQGGRDLEGFEAWRARILARVRDRGRAGKASDYTQWALEGGAATSRVIPKWMGPGTVAVVVAMAGPRTPTPAELARIHATIQQERPVTADEYTLGASLLPVPVTLAISPDTVATRASAALALAALFGREAAIGATLPLSRLDAAVSSASGEYSHRISQPAADVVPAPTEFPVLGLVTFTDAAGLPQAPG